MSDHNHPLTRTCSGYYGLAINKRRALQLSSWPAMTSSLKRNNIQ